MKRAYVSRLLSWSVIEYIAGDVVYKRQRWDHWRATCDDGIYTMCQGKPSCNWIMYSFEGYWDFLTPKTNQDYLEHLNIWILFQILFQTSNSWGFLNVLFVTSHDCLPMETIWVILAYKISNHPEWTLENVIMFAEIVVVREGSKELRTTTAPLD